jgi:DNA-directed RNA polymerase subunit M/transcription elongation factor TFIIS
MTMKNDEHVKTSPSGHLLCPRCGGQMNFHAEKVDRSADPGDADAGFDGVLARFHTCPGCTYVLELAVRR